VHAVLVPVQAAHLPPAGGQKAFEQQSLSVVHALPTAPHAAAHVRPALHTSGVQQPPPLLHVASRGEQHVPLAHVRGEQHCEVVPHAVQVGESPELLEPSCGAPSDEAPSPETEASPQLGVVHTTRLSRPLISPQLAVTRATAAMHTSVPRRRIVSSYAKRPPLRGRAIGKC
jgi:hypothetical protein